MNTCPICGRDGLKRVSETKPETPTHNAHEFLYLNCEECGAEMADGITMTLNKRYKLAAQKEQTK